MAKIELLPGDCHNDRKHLVAARVLVLLLFGFGWGVWNFTLDRLPFLPFIPALDYMPNLLFGVLSQTFIVIFSLGVWFKYQVRLSSFVLGLVILFMILSSKPLYSTSMVFTSCLFIIMGLGEKGNQLVRIQLAIVYLAAGMNKLLDPDWWNGTYFHFFSTEIFGLAHYEMISSLMPDKLILAKFLGVVTILIEVLLGLMFVLSRGIRVPIVIGLLFHVSMLIFTLGQLSVVYFYLMCVAYYVAAFHEGRRVEVRFLPENNWLLFLKRIDIFHSIEWRVQEGCEISPTQKDGPFLLNTIGRILLNHETMVYLFFGMLILLKNGHHVMNLLQ